MSSRAYSCTVATTSRTAANTPLGVARSGLAQRRPDRPAPTGVSRTHPSQGRAAELAEDDPVSSQSKAGEDHVTRRSNHRQHQCRPARAPTRVTQWCPVGGDRTSTISNHPLETEKDRCANTGLSRIQDELEFAGPRSDRRQTLRFGFPVIATRRVTSPPREGFMYPRDMFRIVDRPDGHCQAMSCHIGTPSSRIDG